MIAYMQAGQLISFKVQLLPWHIWTLPVPRFRYNFKRPFNWAILVLNDKVKGKGIDGNLRHIWEKRCPSKVGHFKSKGCVAQVVYNWVRRHVFPGWPEHPRSKTEVGTHIMLNTHHIEIGLKLGILCVLIARCPLEKPKFSKTETY